MNQRQFEQVLRNRRWQPEQPLTGRQIGNVLRDVAARQRRLARAQRAFEQVAPAEWLACGEIREFEDGQLRVWVASPAQRSELARSLPRLTRALQALVPGLQRVAIGCGSEVV